MTKNFRLILLICLLCLSVMLFCSCKETSDRWKIIRLTGEEKTVTLDLTIDTEICPVMEYFEIFLQRMLLCKKAAAFFGKKFEMIINGTSVL